MLKKMMMVMVVLTMGSSVAWADDDLFSSVAGLQADAISTAPIAIESNLDSLDLDGLAQNAGVEATDEAIEACFRHFGYRPYCGFGYGYGFYSYTYYRPVICYRPVYHVCMPVYRHFWGCY